MRLIVRIIGWLFVALALVVLGLDIAASGGEGGFKLVPLGQLWFELHSSSLNLVQAVIERYLWPPLWQSVLFPIVQLPAAVVFGALGLAILLLSLIRRRPPERPRFKE
ncbi:MAG: hypothetical protein R3316_06005 [Rhodovibrionaceae bacterium]|nr:hypothetical protein [Rhodovibrionaceae bacterium]